MKKTIILTFILSLSSSQSAYAYIDPGSGSFLMSIIVGFFVTAGVFIKSFWYKIKSFFGLNKKPNSDIEKDLK
tara:strand:- start:567 stop:785 length:219 start_codon:yes stop_codon:yes gene_type:complete